MNLLNDMKINLIENEIKNFMEINDVPGISISLVMDGEIVYQNGFGYRDVLNKKPVTPQTIWPIASITKSFTAIAAMQLVEQNKLDLNRPVKQYLPYFSISNKKASEMLNTDLFLKHASGLGRTGHQDKYREKNYNPLIINLQPNRKKDIYPTRKALVENLFDAKLQSNPGEYFCYCNEGYATVGHLIEVLSEIKLEDYFDKNIFANLEMKKTFTNFDSWRNASDRTFIYSNLKNSPFYTGIDHDKYAVLELSKDYQTFLSAGGIATTTNDLSLYQIQSMNISNSKLNLNSDSLNKIQNINMPFGKSGWGYGYGYWISYANKLKIIKHGGGLPGVSTYSMMIPSEKTAVAIFANKNEVNTGSLAEIVLNHMRGKVFRNKLNEPLSFKIDTSLTSKNKLNDYLGNFEFRQGISKTYIENGKLCINAPSRLEATPEKLILEPVSKDSFMNLYDGNSISFVRNNKNEISHFLNGGYQYTKV
jgi:CubicO group peptidase (beta-lactamase class C family)